MSGKHTPGPWRWTELPVPGLIGPTNIYIISSDCGECSVSDETTYQADKPADAALIAAAPDLFAALDRLLAFNPSVLGSIDHAKAFAGHLAAARSALAKARGEVAT